MLSSHNFNNLKEVYNYVNFCISSDTLFEKRFYPCEHTTYEQLNKYTLHKLATKI